MNKNLLARHIVWPFLLLGVLSQPLSARCDDNTETVTATKRDSVDHDGNHEFRVRELVLAASLITVGAIGVCNPYFKRLNLEVKDGMDDFRGNHYLRIDDYAQYLPITAYLGLEFIGVKARHSFKERVAAGTISYLCMAILTNSTKHIVKEPRPDSGRRNSFPSGHTATAFTGAELIRTEYGMAAGVAAYTFATGIAFLRLYNGRHWLNDVIAGAGIGILSARVGYWMLPIYRQWFKWNRPKSKGAIAMLPGYDFENHSVSVNFACSF